MRRLGERVEALAFDVLPAPLLARIVRGRCARRRARQRAHVRARRRALTPPE